MAMDRMQPAVRMMEEMRSRRKPTQRAVERNKNHQAPLLSSAVVNCARKRACALNARMVGRPCAPCTLGLRNVCRRYSQKPWQAQHQLAQERLQTLLQKALASTPPVVKIPWAHLLLILGAPNTVPGGRVLTDTSENAALFTLFTPQCLAFRLQNAP